MRNSLKILTKTMAIVFATSIAFSQTKLTKQGIPFPYSIEKCPDYTMIASSMWDSKTIKNFKTKLIKCEVASKMLPIEKNNSILLVQYLYSFKENSEYTSKQQFNFIVDKSSMIILYDYNVQDGCTGTLEDLRILMLNNQPILEITFFWGGTAGYWEEYYTYNNGCLTPIQTTFVDSAKSLIPKGYSLRRTKIEIETMTASIYLATEKDANCCPSGRLDLKLEFKNNDLLLVSGKFFPNQE